MLEALTSEAITLSTPERPALLGPLMSALADRYQFERPIGSGGMGTVYAARDLKLGRRVAIKVLRPEIASALGTERFLREIALTARLEHPHIVSLHDSGTAGGCLYYVMPLVEGRSLRERIGDAMGLPAAEVVRILRDVLDALSYAHGSGIVHRDVKPDNVLLRRRHALVTDFGIAKALSLSSPSTPSLTAEGTLLGTPAYMAPEQTAGDAVDARADLYAVGVMAYEMLVGAPPFEAESVQEMLAMHLSTPPTPLRERRPELPPRLADLAMRCLEKDPRDRWQSADDILALLEDGPGLLRRFPARITTREGFLTVGVDEAPTPPYRYGQPGEESFRGFEIDLLQALAERLDVTLNCLRTSWEAALSGLQHGDLDLICRGVTITPERRRIIAFSTPYLETTLALVVPTKSTTQTLDQIAGHRIGVRVSTLAEEFLARIGRASTVRSFAFAPEPYEALRAGAVDAVVDHLAIAASVVQSVPDLRLVGPLKGSRLQIGFGFSHSNVQLRRMVDDLLADLKEDGTWRRSVRRWVAATPHEWVPPE